MADADVEHHRQNLTPFFQEWRWTLSQSAIDSVSALPVWTVLELKQDAPLSYTTTQNSATGVTTIDLRTNVYDMAGNALTLASLGTPAHGTLTNNGNGTVKYVPAAGYFGPDSFTYTVTNTQGGSITGTVAITVNRADGLTHYWRLDDGQGTSAVDEIGGTTGTLIGTTLPTWSTGKTGGSLVFNGLTSAVDVGASFGSIRNGFTIAAWINPTSVSGLHRIFTRGAGSGGYGFGLNGTGLRFHDLRDQGLRSFRESGRECLDPRRRGVHVQQQRAVLCERSLARHGHGHHAGRHKHGELPHRRGIERKRRVFRGQDRRRAILQCGPQRRHHCQHLQHADRQRPKRQRQ